MGQRLNIEIWNNGDVLASSYYHWSGYTGPAMEMTGRIIDKIGNNMVTEIVGNIVNSIEKEPIESEFGHDILTAIRLLEETGAKISSEELELVKGKFPNETFNVATSRNDGLITITKAGIDNTREWAEADVIIHLDTKRATLGVFFEYDADEVTYMLEEGELDEEDITNAATIDLEYADITFEQFKQLDTFVDEMFKTDKSYSKRADGSVLSLIE